MSNEQWTASNKIRNNHRRRQFVIHIDQFSFSRIQPTITDHWLASIWFGPFFISFAYTFAVSSATALLLFHPPMLSLLPFSLSIPRASPLFHHLNGSWRCEMQNQSICTVSESDQNYNNNNNHWVKNALSSPLLLRRSHLYSRKKYANATHVNAWRWWRRRPRPTDQQQQQRRCV